MAHGFATASEIVFGRGVSNDAAARIRALGSRVLLVHGATPTRVKWLAAELGSDVVRFVAAGEPDVEMIEAGVAAARAVGVDVIAAMGGGAVIDTGKAIAALVPASRPMLDHLEVVGQGLPLEADPLPFVAIPTTAGTGAEVTRNAVIAVPEARRKVSLRDRRMLPDIAIVDPALTDGCPRGVTLASGLDAITQVIEPYVSTRAWPVTDALCRDAIPRGLVALRRLMEAEDPAARDEMAFVSLSGGLALANAGLGAVHGLAGPLGGLTGAPHGALCGTLLPHVVAANMANAEGALAQKLDEVVGWIGDAFGVTDATALDTLAAWSRDAGLPGLATLGVTADIRSRVATEAGGSSSMKSNPVALSAAELEAVMMRAA